MTSGYKTITPIQFANVLFALEKETITSHGLRVYFACFALVAIREAAKRYRTRRREKPKQLAHYRLNELKRLTCLSSRAIKRALRDLSAAGLVQYSEGEIVISTEPLCGSDELLEALSCGRSPKRPIPVPRSMLRFLAQNRKDALSKTVIAYLVRGLSLSKRGGTISNKGTVKASWIAETFNLSERAVRYARGLLIKMGWIERDTGSFQKKLNRDGAYFAIDLEWVFSEKRKQSDLPVENSIVNREKRVTNFAPLPSQNCTNFAPPYKDKKTSYEDKNRKAQNFELRSGVYLGERNSNGIGNGGPRLTKITTHDLFHFDRLELLYFQATQAGWIPPTESAALNFIAAAVRSREVGRDPPRVFVTIVRQGLWHHITQAQEDRARNALLRYREENPDRFRSKHSRLVA